MRLNKEQFLLLLLHRTKTWMGLSESAPERFTIYDTQSMTRPATDNVNDQEVGQSTRSLTALAFIPTDISDPTAAPSSG